MKFSDDTPLCIVLFRQIGIEIDKYNFTVLFSASIEGFSLCVPQLVSNLQRVAAAKTSQCRRCATHTANIEWTHVSDARDMGVMRNVWPPPLGGG